MVKQQSTAKNTQRDTHKEKREEKIKEVKKEESNQANNQAPKWKWILKIRLSKIQNQKHGKKLQCN